VLVKLDFVKVMFFVLLYLLLPYSENTQLHLLRVHPTRKSVKNYFQGVFLFCMAVTIAVHAL